MTKAQYTKAARDFKPLDRLTKSELVSILKECEKRLFNISVTLNGHTVPDAFKTEKELEKTKKSSYEMWYYLGAIGAIRKLKGNALSEMSNDAWCCLKSPLATQRKFLSHVKRKEKKQ